MTEATTITLNDIYIKLNERVSEYNARMLLHSVKINAGITEDDTTNLNLEDAKTICLELIKKGGPAFQVGKSVYGTLQ